MTNVQRFRELERLETKTREQHLELLTLAEDLDQERYTEYGNVFVLRVSKKFSAQARRVPSDE